MIGAGLAGLSAGYGLARAGWDVTVLEARASVGGRVRTLREPLAAGQRAELGAVDRRSVADLLDELGIDGLARLLLDDYVRGDYGFPAELASLLYFVSSEAGYTEVPQSAVEAYRIEGGNDRLASAFAERLGEAVRLRAPVTRIERWADGVRLGVGEGEWRPTTRSSQRRCRRCGQSSSSRRCRRRSPRRSPTPSTQP